MIIKKIAFTYLFCVLFTFLCALVFTMMGPIFMNFVPGCAMSAYMFAAMTGSLLGGTLGIVIINKITRSGFRINILSILLSPIFAFISCCASAYLVNGLVNQENKWRLGVVIFLIVMPLFSMIGYYLPLMLIKNLKTTTSGIFNSQEIP